MKYKISFICLALLLPLIVGGSSSALSGSDFQPGRIIDDSIFYNKDHMSVNDIQSWLNSRVPTCDTWGTKTHSSGVSRATYGQSAGTPPPYICLKDYAENPSTHQTNFNPTATVPAGAMSAAQIIYSAAQDYNISPRVLLATLQKEAADNLIGDDWPWPTQYRSAMGYGCPDTAPCDAEYYGFYNQMYNAARQFRLYANNPGSYRYKSGQLNFVQYNPNADCSGTHVQISSLATAGLYNYTPYQPNQAALNNLYGHGDGCSAYGNRNFWRIYNDWFGSTTGSLWRTESNGTLYLVDGGRKYSINSIGYLDQFGYGAKDVRFVSQQELDAVPMATAPYSSALGQLVKSPSDSDADGGTVYFFDSGRKVPISSMQQLANFGFDASGITYLPLDFIQRYATDAVLSSFVRDQNMSLFQMENNKKRVFFELARYNQVNPSGTFTSLSNFSMERWQFGTPQVEGSYLTTGSDGTIRLYNGQTYRILTAMSTYDCWGFAGMRNFRINDYAVVNGSSAGNLSCIGKNSSGTTFLMNGSVKYQLPNDQSVTASTVADDVLNRVSTGNLPRVIKNSSGELSIIEANIRRALPSMNTFFKLGYTGNDIVAIRQGAYDGLQNGPLKLAPGDLVLDTGGTVSVIDSATTRYTIGSASQFNHYAFSWDSLIRANDMTIAAYTSRGSLPYYVKNASDAYLIDSKKRFLIDPSIDSAVGITRSSLADVGLPVVNAAQQVEMTRFVTSPNGGTVYYLENGQKRPITSWQTLMSLGGNGKVITLSNDALGRFPTGQNL